MTKSIQRVLLICLVAGSAMGGWGCTSERWMPVSPTPTTLSSSATLVPLTGPGASISDNPVPTSPPGAGEALGSPEPAPPRFRPFSTFRTAFDRFDYSLNNGDGYSDSDNLDGTLVWHESYIMMSYLAMYRGTGDVDYLRRLIRHAENVIAQRDDHQGRTDYRGMRGPTWVSTKYSKKPYSWIVHSGMIIYPMADFAQLVINSPDLWNYISYSGQQFIDVANWLKDEVAETIEAHEDQWDEVEKVYRFRDASFLGYSGGILPTNQQAAIGRALLMMHLATGESSYLEKATALALYFRDNLVLDGVNDSYIWHYWPGINDNKEDLSHATIAVDFARLCYENDVVFSLLDVRRFAATFKNNLYIEPLHFARRVDGSGGITGSEPTGGWLPLSNVDRDVYHIVADVFLDKALYAPTEWSGSTFIAIANLHLFQRLFDPIAVNRNPGSVAEFVGIAAGDFDGDGVDEAVAFSNFGGFYVYELDSGQIRNVAFGESPVLASQWAGIAAGDFDADGRDEFVAADNSDGGLYVYELNGGQIQEVIFSGSPGPASQWAGIAAGDFDDDGKDEFVAADNSDGGFYVYELNDDQIENVAFDTSMGPSSQWVGMTAGDFDGDAAHEFIASRSFDGDFYVFCLNDGRIEPIGREFFPGGLENGVLAAGKVQIVSQKGDQLIMIRNPDVDIFVFAIRIED